MNEVNKDMRAKEDEQDLLTDKGNKVSDKEEVEDTIEDKKKEWMVPMTVRFSREANEVFQEIADRNKVSKAHVVRVAAAGGMNKYFANLRYIDAEQGEVINKNLITLSNEISKMTNQLRHIGVNFYNDLRLKYKNQLDTNEAILDKKELDDIVARYEDMVEKVSEALWHIQG